MSREKFEKIVSSPPFELCTERWPNDPAKYAWPGNYKHYNLQLAYDVCMDYSKEQAEQLTIAKQRIAELEKDVDILQTNFDAALRQAALLEQSSILPKGETMQYATRDEVNKFVEDLTRWNHRNKL